MPTKNGKQADKMWMNYNSRKIRYSVLNFLLSLYVLLSGTDMIGAYGPFSVFRLITLILAPVTLVLSLDYISPVFKQKSFRFFSWCILGQVAGLFLTGLLKSPEPLEEFKLILVFAHNWLLLLVFALATSRLGVNRVGLLLYWAVWGIGLANLFAVASGWALYSNTGRLAGIFTSSTTMSFFGCLLITVSLGAHRVRWCGRASSLAAVSLGVGLLFLSGSRAGLIFPFLLGAAWLATCMRSVLAKVICCSAVLVIFSYSKDSVFQVVGDTLIYISETSDLPVARRMGDFARDLSSGAELEDLDIRRSSAREAALSAAAIDIPLLGNGLDSSVDLTPFEIMPHNLFIYTLYEMGVFVSGIYLCMYILGYLYGFFQPVASNLRPHQFFLAILTVLYTWLALKTPYFVQAPMYWLIAYLVVSSWQSAYQLLRAAHVPLDVNRPRENNHPCPVS